MGPNIVLPLVVIAVLVPVGFSLARRRVKLAALQADFDDFVAPSERLTSNALRAIETPPWRVVYEIAPERLGGVGHVLIGPPGVFAMRTTMDPLPRVPKHDADARTIGTAAIVRGGLDDALRRCSLSSDRLVTVHWGINESAEIAVDLMPGVTAIDGRELETWVTGLSGTALTASQIDLAWQSVVTAIGRPDPLT